MSIKHQLEIAYKILKFKNTAYFSMPESGNNSITLKIFQKICKNEIKK